MNKNFIQKICIGVVGCVSILTPAWAQVSGASLEDQLAASETRATELQRQTAAEVAEVQNLITLLNQTLGQLQTLSAGIDTLLATLPAAVSSRLNQFCGFAGGSVNTQSGVTRCQLPTPQPLPQGKRLKVVTNESNVFLDRLGSTDESLSNIPFSLTAGFLFWNNGINRVLPGRIFERNRMQHTVAAGSNCRMIEVRTRVSAMLHFGGDQNHIVRYRLRHIENSAGPRFLPDALGTEPDRFEAFVGLFQGNNSVLLNFTELEPGPADISLFKRGQNDAGEGFQSSQNREYFINPLPSSNNSFTFDLNFMAGTPSGAHMTLLCYE